MISDPLAETYDAYRVRSVAESVPLAAALVLSVGVLYAIADGVINPGGFTQALPEYLVMSLVPINAVWLVRRRLKPVAEKVALVCDVAYTAALVFMLWQPTTATSGAALAIALKLLATALFFPWSARMQYASVVATVALYCTALVLTGRLYNTTAALHQLLGPLIAALFSAVGAAGRNRACQRLFERAADLAAAKARALASLETVRHNERRLLASLEALHESEARLRTSMEAVRASEAGTRRLQAQQQVIFDSLPALIWCQDTEHRIVRINRAAAALAGLPVEALEGRSIVKLYPGAARHHKDDLEVVSSGTPRRGVVEELETASGEKRLVQMDRIPYRDADGAITGVIVFAVDVAAHHGAAAAMSQPIGGVEEDLEVAAALAHVGSQLISALDTPVVLDRLCRLTTEVLRCDLSHVLCRQSDNPAYVPVSADGLTPEEREVLRAVGAAGALIGGLLPRLEHDEVVAVDMNTVREQLPGAVALQQGITHTLHVALRRGSEIFGVLTAGYRKRQEPFSTRQARIAAGIAQLASLALENARLVEETERAHQVKSEFVATVSHELRTPLNVIMGYNDLLLGEQFGPVSAAQRETLERVARNARLLVDLINDTLDLSRLETGRMSIEPEDVRLPDLFAALDSETQELQHKPGVHVFWSAAPDVPTLHTDPLKLKVVLKNLLVNAMKFTESGSVTVAACAHDGGVELSVADTGIGISQEELPLIFEAFRHIDTSTANHHRGAGLGLYLVSRLLDLLGGTIRVDSAVGRGSTFRVWLPGEEQVGQSLAAC